MAKPLFPEVTVNGQVIAQDDIAQEAQNHEAPKGKPGWAWQAGARALVIRELILEEARKMGLSPAAAEVAPGKFETDDESLIRQVLEERVIAEDISEDAITRAFEKHREQFRAPSLYEAAHILFAIKPGADKDHPQSRDKALQKAELVLKLVNEKPKKFGQAARENSDCSSKGNDGMLGQLSTGDTVPEFDAALAVIKVGEVHSELVETEFGFHIIRLDARAEGDLLPYDSVKITISDAMERAAWAQAAQRFTAELVAAAKITGLHLKAAA